LPRLQIFTTLTIGLIFVCLLGTLPCDYNTGNKKERPSSLPSATTKIIYLSKMCYMFRPTQPSLGTPL